MPAPRLAAAASRHAATPDPRPTPADRELAGIVEAARDGDGAAWTRLIERFDDGLRHVARSYRLSPADVDDVMQQTWTSLVSDIERIRAPAAIAGWLTTTTRRAALRTLQLSTREVLTDDPQPNRPADVRGPAEQALDSDLRAVLTRALATLPERHRAVMTVLLTQPSLEYREVSRLLDMPQGSIGPIRARSLLRLARNRELRMYDEAAAS